MGLVLVTEQFPRRSKLNSLDIVNQKRRASTLKTNNSKHKLFFYKVCILSIMIQDMTHAVGKSNSTFNIEEFANIAKQRASIIAEASNYYIAAAACTPTSQMVESEKTEN